VIERLMLFPRRYVTVEEILNQPPDKTQERIGDFA